MSSKAEFAVAGYIRENGKEYKLTIPQDLWAIFLLFYQRTYRIYGIGTDGYNEMGLHRLKSNNYDGWNTKEKWVYLSEMSKLCQHPSFITVGEFNTFLQNARNEIYGIGCNIDGSLGVNQPNKSTVSDFTRLHFTMDELHPVAVDVISQSIIGSHKFVVFNNIKTNKQIFYGFGANRTGEIGFLPKKHVNFETDTDEFSYAPIQISTLNKLFSSTKITDITTGIRHSLFLSSSGKVYACGDNLYGQCGVQSRIKHITPQIVPLLFDIMSIASGDDYNLCLDKNNALWVFGRNTRHQLGLGPDYDTKKLIDKAMINPYVNKHNLVFIQCGCDISLCISQDGKAYMFGCNEYGECGNGQISTTVNIPYCIQSMKLLENVVFMSGLWGKSYSFVDSR